MMFMHPGRVCLLIAVLTLCGCAGYRVGPTNGRVAGAQSVQITPFLNHSPEPGLADELTGALRRSIQNDGTLRLATDGSADLIVAGVITEFRRRELSLLTEDVRTVRDYQVTLVVHLTVRNRATGSVVLERDVSGGTVMRVGSDLASSERQLAPILARDLAREITHLLVDGDW
jgi:hypothetical protein